MNAIVAALVNGAILSALLTAGLWLALLLVPRRFLNAATRYAVWWAALAVVVVMPALFLHRPSPSPHFPMAPREAAVAAPADFAVTTPLGTPISGLAGSGPARRTFAWPSFPIRIVAGEWSRWILGLWLIASASLLIRLTVSWIILQRFCARAFYPPAALRTRAAHWLALCGSTRRNVRMACSTDVAIPAAVGPFRPAILIPASLFGELDENALDQIGLHEAAHLARQDDYALAVQRILEALFALHPVVRWIARRIDLEREIACDDFVLAVTGQSKSYAWCLTRMVELTAGASPSPAAVAATSNLARRVDMLLDKTRHTGTRPLRARLAVVIAALAALAWAVGRSPDLLAFVTPPVQTAPRTPPSPILAPMPAQAAESPQRPASDKPPAATAPPEIAATVASQTEHAGQAVAAPPAFEVASIKPADPAAGGSRYGMRTSPGLLSAPAFTLRGLVGAAYGVKGYQITGGPRWIASAQFELEAKPANPASREQLMLMLRSLLADRFKLALHEETRELPVYALVVAKNGPKLRTESASDKRMLRLMSLPALVDYLNMFAPRPVIDKTGLTWNSPFDLHTGEIDAAAADDAGGTPSMLDTFQATLNALEDQLGLKLTPTKAPIQVLVIDGAERPSEN